MVYCIQTMIKLARVHYKNRHIEPVWHVQAALLLTIVLQLFLNSDLTVGPNMLIVGLELGMLALLAVIQPKQQKVVNHLRRTLAVLLIALVSLANLGSLALVIYDLFNGSVIDGKHLILSALAIYITNIIIFGLWYWELDSDGVQGQSTDIAPVDFLFPQMYASDKTLARQWSPTFFDYLYISIANGTAFGTNDAAPLTHRAKLLMTIQSFISIAVVALVITRAVSILA